MRTLTLRRRYFDDGTFATLHSKNGEQLCATVERPWQNNTPRKSCIPEGTYRLIPHTSPKFGECYALEANTLGVTRYGPSLRTHILIHAANLPSQLQGCIAPGEGFGVINNQWGVINSRNAFNKLMAYLDNKEWQLIISH
ncbi:DUF5675 family protein [Thaumasiovibrio subtropicus]|uniref:DUF5675 family protein n=1 Tax=Thaumasiovibrio subtropicus TaxID=1891207 RepID=UPI000B35FCEF|nr:DUF5675 family protein [Thaumasiovibrio subtropicus]